MGSITDPIDRAWALAELARAAMQAGDVDRGEALARTIARTDDRALVLGELARAVAQAGDLDRAVRVPADAESVAHILSDPDDLARTLTELAPAVAQAGDPDRAVQLAATLSPRPAPSLIPMNSR